jgi:hypothetical protein
LQQVIADLYIAYDDPVCGFKPPFHLKWVIGLGNAESSGERPVPTHPIDLLVVDNDGRTVFDSREATSYHVQPWGSRIQVVQWVDGNEIGRLAYFTTLESEDDFNAIPLIYFPTQSVLQPRTIQRNMPRLSSIRVGLDEFSETPIDLVAGYNVRLEVRKPTPVDGQRRRTQIVVHGEPGAGLGRYSNCDDVDPILRRLGGATATPAGDFYLDGDNCYRINVPITGTTGNEATTVPNTVEINQHCRPCRSCDDMIETYKALASLWDRNDDSIETLHGVRDDLQTAIDQWEAQKACREAYPISIFGVATCPCLVSVAVGFCNMSDENLQDVTLSINFSTDAETGAEGAVLCGSSVVSTGQRGGSFSNTQVPGTWPNYSVFWSCVDKGGSATVKMSLQFTSCLSLQPLLVTAQASTSSGLTFSPVQFTLTLVPASTDGSCGSCQ